MCNINKSETLNNSPAYQYFSPMTDNVTFWSSIYSVSDGNQYWKMYI